jgi:hypothetical protein
LLVFKSIERKREEEQKWMEKRPDHPRENCTHFSKCHRKPPMKISERLIDIGLKFIILTSTKIFM